MSVFDDIKARLGYLPPSQWQMEQELSNAEASEEQAGEPTARAARKRAGLPVDNAQHEQTQETVTEKKPEETAEPQSGNGGSEFSLAEYVKTYHPYSPANMQKREEEAKRRRKRDAVFAAIGDGMNAFHQAYSYARGVKPLTENKSQMKEVRDKYENLEREYDANKIAHLNAYMRALQYDEGKSNKVKDFELKERQQKRLEEEAKRKYEASQAQIKAYEARANKDDQLAALYEAKAESIRIGDDNKTREYDAKIKVLESQVNKNNSAAAASDALAEQRSSDKVVRQDVVDARGRTTHRTTTTSYGNGGSSRSGVTQNKKPATKKPASAGSLLPNKGAKKGGSLLPQKK